MRAENFDIDIIINSLRGSCDTIDNCVSDIYEGMTENDLTEEDHAKIDSEIFCCSTCNWWSDLSEEADEETKEAHGDSVDDQICTDCCPLED